MNETAWTGPHAIDDPDRLAVVHSYGVLDTPTEERFDRITRLVARTLDVPVAIVTIADEARLWFKSTHGTDVAEVRFQDVPRGAAFCAEVVSHGQTLVVENAAADPRFVHHPAVAAGDIGFYAGTPLRSPRGPVVGTLCALAAAPRTITAAQIATLEDLAATVVDELELTRQTAELGRSRARTEQVLDATGTGFFAVDATWRIADINEQGARFCRLPRAEIVGKSLWELFPGAIGTAFEHEFTRALRERVVVDFEAYFAPFDAWFEARAYPFEGGLSIYFTDVTARHRMEAERTRHVEEIAERERAFRTLTEALPDVIARYDRDLRLVYINSKIEHATGMTPEELVGKRSRELQVSRTVARAHERQLRQVLASGETLRRSFSYDTPTGRRHYDAILVPERGPDGRTTSVISATRDVTAEREAEAAIAVAQDRYRALSQLVAAYAFAYRVDEHGTFHSEWYTDTVEDVLGYSPDELLHRAPGTLSHPDDRTVWIERTEHLLRGEEYEHTLRILHKDGSYRWIHVYTYPIVDARRQVTGCYGAAQDVTEQVEDKAQLLAAKERAEEASRLKDAFLANMSHEIRTPLTAILGFSELLREEAPEHLLDFIDPIELGGRRLMETLTSVLDLSQLRAGTIALAPRRCDAAALARETLALLQPKAARKGIALVLDAPTVLPACLDSTAFGRVVTNLVENAIKFTDLGRVDVIVARAHAEGVGDAVRVTVRDTGCGMEASFLPHLFDEFRQESSGLARSHEGSGLGLAITKGLIGLMGGTVRVESTPGVGTAFEVAVPTGLAQPGLAQPGLAQPGLAQPGAVPAESVAGAAASVAVRRGRVLVIEDSEPTRELLRILLGRHVDLVLADGAAEAMALLGDGPWDVDLVLLDIHLGEGVSGLDLLPQLRARSAGHATQFVALTAYALPGDADRLLAQGFDGYLGKPFTQTALRALLTRTFGTSLPSEPVSGDGPPA